MVSESTPANEQVNAAHSVTVSPRSTEAQDAEVVEERAHTGEAPDTEDVSDMNR